MTTQDAYMQQARREIKKACLQGIAGGLACTALLIMGFAGYVQLSEYEAAKKSFEEAAANIKTTFMAAGDTLCYRATGRTIEYRAVTYNNLFQRIINASNAPLNESVLGIVPEFERASCTTVSTPAEICAQDTGCTDSNLLLKRLEAAKAQTDNKHIVLLKQEYSP